MGLTFRLRLVNDKRTIGEPDKATVTANPISAPIPSEEPKTIYDIHRNINISTLNIINFIDLSNKIDGTNRQQ